MSSESGDEFFDCQENVSDNSSALNKWSSLELLSNEPEDHAKVTAKTAVASEPHKLNFHLRQSEMTVPSSPNLSPSHQHPSP